MNISVSYVPAAHARDHIQADKQIDLQHVMLITPPSHHKKSNQTNKSIFLKGNQDVCNMLATTKY